MALHHQAEPLSAAAKQERLREFLDKLADDHSLNKTGDDSLDITELTEDGFVKGSLAPIAITGKPVDLADLLSNLLREQGLGSSSEELVEHVLEGGSVETFLNKQG
ncbi:hypothetical protein SAMN05444162_3313 [Paenibacillaceae bacterium GAS479]|nr:hypothetical protein SAMN05444162_3313 [Paenibacillaceae bacterium GAS479]